MLLSSARGPTAVPEFLRAELDSSRYSLTGFEADFPALSRCMDVLGYRGESGFGSEVIKHESWWKHSTQELVGWVMFKVGAEGPPATAHGGAVATALDQTLGLQAWRSMGYSRAGIPTASLSVRYKRPAPLEKQLLVRAKTTRREGRKAFLTGSISDPDSGKLVASAEGIFHALGEPGVDIIPWEVRRAVKQALQLDGMRESCENLMGRDWP
ncbi:unnamed protein product [Chrysoparadoxa australica]